MEPEIARGTPYDGKIRLKGVYPISVKDSGFLPEIARNKSRDNALKFYTTGREMDDVVKQTLVDHGLLHVAPLSNFKSTAVYDMTVSVVGYHDERLTDNRHLGLRVVDRLISHAPEHYSDEMINRGCYTVRASYQFKVVDRQTKRIIHSARRTAEENVRVYINNKGLYRSKRDRDDADLLADLTSEFLSELVSQPAQ